MKLLTIRSLAVFAALSLAFSLSTEAIAQSCKSQVQALLDTSVSEFEDAVEVSNSDSSASVVLERNIRCKKGLFGWQHAYGYSHVSGSLAKKYGQEGYVIIFLTNQQINKFVFNKAKYKIGNQTITSDIVYQAEAPFPFGGKMYNIVLTEPEMKRIAEFYTDLGQNQMIPLALYHGGENLGLASLGYSNEIVAVYNKMQSLK
ncbi:MAG: hypothetical protein AAGE37_03695 [Pseudomonadota bacterium]